jgi:dTDP-4-dehydrorhamnose reductase
MIEHLKVLVLGASGMLGNAVMRFFYESSGISVVGSVRSAASRNLLPKEMHGKIVSGVDMQSLESLSELVISTRPDVVINCVGVVKQLAQSESPLEVIPINSLLPHQLHRICKNAGARFIHISTDCVFRGTKGLYREEDIADAIDLYGRSKLLGEVNDPSAVTLRTSIIGPELQSAHGLVGWFLSQRGRVRGFRRAIFSGLPTVELSRIIRDFVIPRPDLSGILHVSAEPINKYELLRLIARIYEFAVVVEPDDALAIDRSLDSTRFRVLTGYDPPQWPELVQRMHEFG